ncbi:dnaJ homolog subfamily C member 10-like [Mytilus galloprovincialis]|uniref:dnaJ homolog subfamily C member 10-like n=1 Tax=Mytilus galloprovincialis TaxID=29158 RepID=UPI003F7BFD3C
MHILLCTDMLRIKQLFTRVFILFICVLTMTAAEDYYKLLGIQRSATTKEIRQAFKKLAVTMHPDKNPDDPEAHDNFLKINRAYEVLKDEDMRKKFDMHGEEGLKDDFHGGNRYESWKFYQEEFGLYDDDKEIITLSKSDFEQSVEESGDTWFINYYSAHCGHCHDLAPAWRELAQELAGVIRIGAVNCGDDWNLCRMQGIRSYPTLVMYPTAEKYHGDRTTRKMVKFALKSIQSDAYTLRSEEEIEDNGLPWLISFCGDSGDCLSSTATTKLSAILTDLVNVASVDCHKDEKFCEKLGIEHGTYYYPTAEVAKDEGKKISSLNAQEIAYQVLSWLPDVDNLDSKTLKKIINRLKTGQHHTWLIHFVEGDGSQDIEFRKLPAMLEGIKIGRVDCKKLRSECNELHVMKFPSFVVYKQTGGFELYYGRATAHDVSAFAKDSMTTKLESLTLDDFQSQRVGPSSQSMWFIDFFAPWCPPCMRLLPEFRKAARNYEGDDIGFGTVDCTVHNQLCQMYNIRSYPTTILYNSTKPHQYSGHHSAEHILEFIQDTLNPPVIIVTEAMFEERVVNKKPDEIWLIDWFANWCGPCQQLAPEWRRLAKMFKETKNIYVGQVDCADPNNQWFCQNNKVHSYPTVRLYSSGSGTGSFFAYNGWNRDAQSLQAWAFEFLPSKVKKIKHRDFFNNIINSKTPWVIDYYAPWCGHCQVFKPEFVKIAEALDGLVKAGTVNCDEEQALCNQAGVRAYPTVKFYKGARKEGMSQDTYGYDLENLDATYITNFLKSQVQQQQQHDEL